MRAILAIGVLAVLAAADPVENRDLLWCRFRGPAHGRAQVARAPGPPLELAWTVDLWDPNDNGLTNDHLLYEPGKPIESASPWALGIAWRADRKYLYAFETGFYSSGQGMGLFDRRTGRFLGRFVDAGSQPLANKRVFSVHDDPGIGAMMVFHGNFYAGQTFHTVADGKLVALGERAPNVSIGGHACDGPRWFTRGLHLDGRGARIEDGPSYTWGNNLVWWNRADKTSKRLLEDVAVPSAAWNDENLVLFVRGGLSAATNKGTFRWQEYVRISLTGAAPMIVARRRVTDFEAPTGQMLFEDPPIRENGKDERARMLNRARNTVHALALSADGHWVYCHERRTANTQRIVRRSLDDFRITGAILPDDLPLVRERGFAGQVNVELGVGFCVDRRRVYLQLADRLVAYSLDLSRRIYEVALPPRTLNAHTPFAMTRMIPQSNLAYAARGTEATLATDGKHLYLTTDTTFEVRACASGERLWVYQFKRLPAFERTFSKGGRYVEVRHYGLPGDVILAEDAVYVGTHNNQARIFCFRQVEPR